MSQEGAVNKFRNWSMHSHIKVNTQKLLLGIEKYFNIFVLKDHRSNPPPRNKQLLFRSQLYIALIKQPLEAKVFMLTDFKP